MTSKTARVMRIKCLTLLSVLLLAACDGGIFGTGGVLGTGGSDMDEAISGDAGAADTQTPNATPSATAGGSENATATAGTTAGDSDTGTAGAIPTEPNTDGSQETGGTTAGTATTGGTTGTGTTGGTTGTGTTDGGATGGSTDSGTAGDSADSTSGDSDSPPVGVNVVADSNIASADNEGEFVNNAPTLANAEARVLVVNTSGLTLNVIESSTEPATLLLDNAGVGPDNSSASFTLTNNVTSLSIVNNSTPDQALIDYPQFDVDASTLTTLLVRENGSELSAVALATETNTSDPTLAKIRVVQAGTLGDALLKAQVFVRSAGENPGGVDITIGPLSFGTPVSVYSELRAADYEIVDDANRFAPFALTLAGGKVYTVLLVGNGDNEIVVINDSEAAER